jgi:hypothetical protein
VGDVVGLAGGEVGGPVGGLVGTPVGRLVGAIVGSGDGVMAFSAGKVDEQGSGITSAEAESSGTDRPVAARSVASMAAGHAR